jgi:hypothetical protein
MAFSIALNREYVFEQDLGKEGGQLPHESLGTVDSDALLQTCQGISSRPVNDFGTPYSAEFRAKNRCDDNRSIIDKVGW